MTESPHARTSPTPRFWPSSPQDLVDTTLCPSCFRRLPGAVCGFCGLDLRSPLSAELLAVARSIVRTESERQTIIAQIRQEALERSAIPASPTPARRAPQPFAPPSAPSAPSATSTSGPSASDPSAIAASDTAAAGAWPAEPESRTATTVGPPPSHIPRDPGEAKRSPGQILLLTAGVVMVSVAAIFFAVLAYVVASVELRSVLTAVASLVVLGIAWALRSRHLAGTAEGVAVIGVVLLLLDVWIIRLNRLFDADALDAWLYTGIAFAVLIGVLLATSRLTGLRSTSVSAAVIAPVGLFSLVVGATASLADDSTRGMLGAVSAMLLIALERTARVPGPERVVLRAVSLVAGAVATAMAALAFPSLTEAGAPLALTITTAAWSLVIGVLHPRSTSPVGAAWTVLASIGLALSVSGLAFATAPALGASSPADDAWRPTLLVLGATVILAIARRVGSALRATLRVAAAIVSGIGALAVVPPLWVILDALADTLTAAWFRSGVLDPLVARADGIAESAFGVAATALLSRVALRIIGRTAFARGAAWVPVVLVAIAVTAGALAVPWALASVALLLVGATVSLATARRRRLPAVVRASAFGCGIGLLVLCAALAPASSAAWPIITLLVVLAAVAARLLAADGRVPGRPLPVIASIAATLIALGAGGVAPSWIATIGTAAPRVPDAFGVAAVGAVILVVLALLGDRVPRVDAIVTAAIATVATLGAWLAVAVVQTAWSDVGWRVALAAVVLVAQGAWLRASRPVPPRIIAAATCVPTTAILAAELSVLLARSVEGLGTLAAATVLVLVAAVGAVRSNASRGTAPSVEPTRNRARVALAAEIALFVTGGAVVVLTAIEGSPIGPLSLLVLAVAPVLVAFRPIGDRYPRRHLAWFGALLAVGALWWFLGDRGEETIEYYSLPVAGLLLVIASVSLVIRRRDSSHAPTSPSRLLGTEAVLAGAITVAVLPSTFASTTGDSLRGQLVVGAGLLLLLVCLVAVRDTATVRARSIGWFGAVVAVAAPVLIGSLANPLRAGDEAVAERLWLLAVVSVALLGGAITVSRLRPSLALGHVAATASGPTIAIVIALAVLRGEIGGTSALPWLLVICAIAVVATTRPERIASITVTTSVVGGIGVGIAMLGAVPDVEWVSVPLGSAAVVAGALALRRRPDARSWPMLAPGLVLLLLPSLAHDFGDTTLWRVVAVGVAAVVVLLIGVWWRLQAPLVIGGVVVIVHALAQLWPWISGLYEAGYWWLWAGIGGTVLIVFAARYEQRMRDIRSARTALLALR
ncbi:SCO7613 C-terminal domain-containing membrane protein [Labedella endophytica]|uniref:DUF2157 domain-containing protein n=1 Tax=Labedella endophytica TaxID=1523160 RepID=A0A3S0WV46_9MICO|nr:hypothetical protein [Labedella endophytica]RUQ97525.1 hypothetical protein ELQ94_15215 [Labedella endophytica]